MKKLKLILAVCLSSCLGFAQPKVIYTAAGTGTFGFSGDNGFGSLANISQPSGVAVDNSGNIYFSDYNNNRVRKINTKGIITTIAGTGVAGYNGDGIAATSAKLYAPIGLAVDAAGNIYISDNFNNRIRKVTVSTGIISTVAGTGTGGYNGDGISAISANLTSPYGVALDASGNIYFGEYSQRIRKVTISNGLISTVAGIGTAGYNGDGIAATSAQLNTPMDVVVDGSGNIYIADTGNNRIRKVTASTGIISTVAGTGTAGYNGDGIAATSAQISAPVGVAVLPSSGSWEIYVSERNGSRIRKVNTLGIINTATGTGTAGYNGDGILSTSAQINFPVDLAVDAAGQIYFSDAQNYRVRVIPRVCPANGGPDKNHQQAACAGAWPGVQIGTPAVPNMTYSWIPNPGNLTSYTIAQPISNTLITRTYTVIVSNTNCVVATSTVKVTPKSTNPCRLIGEEYEEPLTLSVYPNPSNSNVTISTHDNAESIRILDMQGKVVFEIKNTTMETTYVDISKYTPGIYIVVAKIGDTMEQQKLIVE